MSVFNTIQALCQQVRSFATKTGVMHKATFAIFGLQFTIILPDDHNVKDGQTGDLELIASTDKWGSITARFKSWTPK